MPGAVTLPTVELVTVPLSLTNQLCAVTRAPGAVMRAFAVPPRAGVTVSR